ncbi:hypothetical protein N431DRAFT_390218 [Stipitochalara longipes BDJ]|nr:hypothetical protein N431DRAFT_390218 [Stipitochalara longipes BDJ]
MTKPWADQPFALIPPPTASDGISKETVQIASGMTFAHNLMFRTLNSITLQYGQLRLPTDIADFLTYCQCFHEMVHSHHHHEETFFFPAIEAYSGVKGIMDTNFAQHQAFEGGVKKFGEYVYSCKVEKWDRAVFKDLLEGFTGNLVTHLREEIPTLLALDKYGGEKLKKAWADMEKEIFQGPMDMYRVLPCGLGSIDNTYSPDRAPFPFFVPYLCHYWYMRRHKGAWRFSPCTVFGKPKELPFAVEEK